MHSKGRRSLLHGARVSYLLGAFLFAACSGAELTGPQSHNRLVKDRPTLSSRTFRSAALQALAIGDARIEAETNAQWMNRGRSGIWISPRAQFDSLRPDSTAKTLFVSQLGVASATVQPAHSYASRRGTLATLMCRTSAEAKQHPAFTILRRSSASAFTSSASVWGKLDVAHAPGDVGSLEMHLVRRPQFARDYPLRYSASNPWWCGKMSAFPRMLPLTNRLREEAFPLQP
jgi:hypothetical protein